MKWVKDNTLFFCRKNGSLYFYKWNIYSSAENNTPFQCSI